MFDWIQLLNSIIDSNNTNTLSTIQLYADIPTQFEEELKGQSLQKVFDFVNENYLPNERKDLDNLIPICGVLNNYGYEEDATIHLVDPYTGKFYSVHGAHCSCYGFEEQFKIEENPVPYLMTLEYADHIKKVIEYFASRPTA